MRVLVCGSRHWADYEKLEAVLSKLPEATHIIGGGAQGADAMARKFAFLKGRRYTEVKADWNKYGRMAGPIRNRKMLDMLDPDHDFVIAFHDDPGLGLGTKDTVEEAKKRGIPVEIYLSGKGGCMKKCDHEWTVENALLGQMVAAIVVCLKCNTLKKPLGQDGKLHLVTEGTRSQMERDDIEKVKGA